MVNDSKIYLDHAATGWPKAESVYRAVEHQMRVVGVAAGRGSYNRALVGGKVIQRCRLLASYLFHSDPDGDWILASNGTAALNQAIHGTLQPGDHVITTAADHNSVLRPLEWLRSQGIITTTIIPCDHRGAVDVVDIKTALKPNTRMLAVTHASNVTGAVNDIKQFAATIRQSDATNCLVLCDAAQSAGQLPIDILDLDIDMLATPGHKGLGGPLGTGLLYVGPRVTNAIQPIMQGGTGSHSDSLKMPNAMPYRLESGNQNVPALAGLAAGLDNLQEEDLSKIYESNSFRVQKLISQISSNDTLTVRSAGQLPIISVTHQDIDPQDLAAILDSEFDIETRAGLHCAPLIHPYLRTAPCGTLRISFSHHTSDDDLQTLVNALAEVSVGI